MPERQRKKDQFRLNQGINTESNEINFPDGFTTDEQNYELLVDGSRRRRKALDTETGGSTLDPDQTIGASHAFTTYKWRGAAGDPANNFIVHQIGTELFFSNDAETISTTFNAGSVDMLGFRVDPTNVSSATVEDEVCQFSDGRGVLLVTHKYTKPFYVTYDSTADTFKGTVIEIRARDFDGIDDGVAPQLTPAALSADHEYNLRNRGWIAVDIETFNSDQSVYPAKNMIWFKGYRRQTDVAFSDLDGIQIFDSDKLVSEQFGQSDAPQGGLLLNPVDTTFAASNTNEGAEVPITNIVIQSGNLLAGGTWRVTATAHGRITNDVVTISGTLFIADPTFGNNDIELSLDGFHTITRIDDDNFDITMQPYGPYGLENFENFGQINGNVSLPKSDGRAIDVGPTAVAFFAGRSWFAGIQDSEWADTVFFSKIAQKPIAFGVCYQEADPTNPEFNQLSSSDGGTVVVPNIGKVQRMIPMRDVLLIFSDNGVWEIGGGQRGAFTATGFSVRKITNAECSSARSPILIGNSVIYTGPRGVHRIAPNEFTSVLEEVNLSEALIQTLWNTIPAVNQQVVQTVHDDALNRVYFLYGDSGLSGSTDNVNQYANALVLDLRVGAWYKYRFAVSTTSGIVTAYAITDSDTSESRKKIKFSTQSTNDVVTTDFDHTDYIDFGGSESPLPFMITGWDDIGDFQSRRQAPVLTVFSKRTETGYTQTGNGWDADNESSTLMSAFWDWTEATQWDVPALPTTQEDWDGSANNFGVSGKVGSQNEVYRHVRGFVPLTGTDVDGYPVVVTRNKVRGRGRVLQLRFDGAATKDSHLLGFTTNYKVSRGK